ncbi:MAG: ABC transporter ATP-binding protein, partial [Proteobacteria bacterium]|nr:ABC transporter ATP-binding protein [Pseudomonadota bacterium]
MSSTAHDGAGPPRGGRPTADSTAAAKPHGPQPLGRAAAEPAIELKGLRKTYKMGRGKPGKEALMGIDLTIERGELFGLLGPNGAGKTTLLKCLATLLEIDGGEAFVNGHSVRTRPDDVRLSMNLVGSGHWVGFDWGLNLQQNLHFFGTLYGLTRGERQERIDATLERLGLAHLRKDTPRTLSSGERQRLLLAKGFMIRTPVFLLDEPTVGLDPEGAHEVRQFIHGELIGREGTSGILTTHRMPEAEAMCRRIAIMDRVRTVAVGTTAELKALVGSQSVLELRGAVFPLEAIEAVRRVEGVRSAVAAPAGEGETMEETLRVHCDDAKAAEKSVAERLRGCGVVVTSVALQDPTLEDAF